MKRVALTLLTAALVAACAELPPGDYALVPLEGQLVTPSEYTYEGTQGRYRVEVRSAMDVTMAPEATRTPTVTPNAPEPSVTPSPSRTPVLAPSATFTPTATLTASPTSSATATPNGILTPTPEGPTATPGPSSTATVEPKPALCEGVVVNQAGLNVRAAPSTNAAVVGTLSGDAVAVIDRFYIVSDDREEWAHLTSPVNGWVAAVFYNGRRLLAWPEDVTDGERAIWCLPPYVTVEWASNPPPTPPPQSANPRGLHLIYSALPEPVLETLPALGTLKATDGAEWALVEGKRRRGDALTTVYRVLYTAWGKLDCPPGWGVGDPVAAADAWYDMLHTVWASRGLLGLVEGPGGRSFRVTDRFEYRNECLFVGDWEVAFDRQMLRRATAVGICLLAFSDAPGTPELAQFAQRRPVLDEMLARPCRPGEWHGIALHIYFGRDSGPWLFGRWRLFRQVAGAKYDALTYWFTEYGVPDVQGQLEGRGVPDCGAIRDELAAADAIFGDDPGVAGYHAYSVGGGTEWLDLSPCLPALRSMQTGQYHF